MKVGRAAPSAFVSEPAGGRVLHSRGVEQSRSAELDVSAWARTLWRRRWVILAVTAVGLLAAGAFSSRSDPVYRSSSQVLVQTDSIDGVLQPLGYDSYWFDPSRALANEVVLINSDATRAAVAEELGYSASVRVVIDEEADLLTFSATSTDPSRAADIVNAYVRTFDERRREAVVDEAVKLTELLNARAAAIDDERAELATELEQARLSVVAASADTERQQRAEELERLEDRQQSRIAALDTEEAGIDATLSAVNLSSELRDGSGVRVVTVAVAPDRPIGASPVRTYLVAGLAAAIAGVALALLLDLLDNRVMSRSDLERSAGGLPTLALVPRSPDDDQDGVVSIAHPQSRASEAYRTLRTSLQFLGIERPVEVVLVTSASAAEGKTTTAANLGVALARLGKRVVLLDCDLRKPRLVQRFGLVPSMGLTDVLVGACELVDVAQRVPDERGLVVVPAGSPPPNPSELLASSRMTDLVASVAAGVDVVIIDSPPVLPVTDARVLTGLCDGVLLVAQVGRSQRRHLQRAVEVLEQLDAPLLGAVLTNAAEEGGASGADYYGDYYEDEITRRNDGHGAGDAPAEGAPVAYSDTSAGA